MQMSTINTGSLQLMQEMQRLSMAAQSGGGVDMGLNSLAGAQTGLSSLTGLDGVSAANQEVSFADVLKSSLDQVNAAQNSAETLQTQYEMGAANVDLSDVMISMQKAGLSLQMVQNLRTRVIAAYQDLMNTPL
jgi:flagellar hook-basal body complex protein FliE